MGINNLLTLTSNKTGFKPLVINGGSVKSINQFYNKTLAKYKSELPNHEALVDSNGNKRQILATTNKINELTHKRNMKINNDFHHISRFIVNLCVKHNIGTVVIGKNVSWKNEINIGSKNNQNFVYIPYNKLICMIKYKCELYGIKVIETEESYTSKASFLDFDEIPVYSKNGVKNYVFSGVRVSRGLYKSKSGLMINTDVNGSYNIIRKVFPNEFSDGIEDVVVHPEVVKSLKDFHRFL